MDGTHEAIDSPIVLRRLSIRELRDVARELRTFVLDSVSRTGGHLSSNLGTVELTVALHYVFDTPQDRIIWDVGHQAYVHKILTGRRHMMNTLRQPNGISGFPRRDESGYDAFGTGHSSTSISAALGMAQAAYITDDDRHCVAVIGDGALSAGMAFEALNHAGLCENLRLLVVLNDNDMSISPPVGALRDHFLKLLSNHLPAQAKEHVLFDHSHARARATFADHTEKRGSDIFKPANLFNELGFNYTGPVDGHDLDTLIPALQTLRTLKGPQILHVVTRKGCGYAPAEADPVLYHGPGRFDPTAGVMPRKADKPTYTQIFGQWLCDEAERDSRVVAITPAMREGSGLVEFEKRFPTRYFDVGIAEQHAVTFAAGLAAEGLKPVVAIYSTFLQRAYDQLIHDVALQRLPVVFAIDRAGVVGADGASHMGAFDIAFLRCIPNLVVMAPADEDECRQMLHTALLHDGPVAVRYPRGSGPGITPTPRLTTLPTGRAVVLRQASSLADPRIAILAFGSRVSPSLAAGERLDATVVNMRFIKPLDEELLLDMANTHDFVVTVEEGCIAGGAGAACMEYLAAARVTLPVLQLGFADRFIEHGDPTMILAECGLDDGGIETSIRQFVADLAASHSNANRSNVAFAVHAMPAPDNESPYRGESV
ncbi:1-deoxy-D-xylulose-5-phosphate synthase [Burkholderia sp. Bp9126]|nr:1-deoxy-D-xylulose-5-phosphate synthase [Burkholderia sp. Bp9126]